MKNHFLPLLFFIFVGSLAGLHAQTRQELSAQIDSARTMAQMPILHFCMERSVASKGYYFVNGKVVSTDRLKEKGECFTLYYPVYINSSGKCMRNFYYYDYSSTSPLDVTDTTLLVHRNISMGLSKDDQQLYYKWMDKYKELGKVQWIADQRNEEKNRVFYGTADIAVVFDINTRKPVKVYADVTDCIGFMHDQKPGTNHYSYQRIDLYYKNVPSPSDSARWRPNDQMLIDDVYRPETLKDEYLATDSVYLVMMTEHEGLADRAYTRVMWNDDKAKEYIENFNPPYSKVLYLYRNKRSYEKIYEIKKKRLGIK